MSRYYADAPGLRQLLRPMTQGETGRVLDRRPRRAVVPAWVHAWDGLYRGTLLADDIEELARRCWRSRTNGVQAPFRCEIGGSATDAGNHDEPPPGCPTRSRMRSTGRAGNERQRHLAQRAAGVGANPYEVLVVRSRRRSPLAGTHAGGAARAPRAGAAARRAPDAGERTPPGAVAARPAGVPARAVVAVPARGAVGGDRHPPRRGARRSTSTSPAR